MRTILSLDLGKFKSVACWYDVASGEARFHNRAELRALIAREPVDLVVFEACTLAGWVYELCQELGVTTQVAATNGEAWKWKNVKRKTDRDDALKLAQRAALKQPPQVRMPTRAVREKREDARIVMVTGYGAIATAVAAVKAGAVDYLSKPADADDVVKALLATGDSPEPPENPMSADRVRWEHIQRVYELCDHNVSETARRLGMHRRTLQRILAKRAPR